MNNKPPILLQLEGEKAEEFRRNFQMKFSNLLDEIERVRKKAMTNQSILKEKQNLKLAERHQ